MVWVEAEEIHPRLPAWLGAEAAEEEVLPPPRPAETERFPARVGGADKSGPGRPVGRGAVAEEAGRRAEEPRGA